MEEVQAVLQAEKEAEEAILHAQQEAEKIISQAKQDALTIISNEKEKINKELDCRTKAKAAKVEQERTTILEEAQKKAKQLRKSADKNKEKAKTLILDRILDVKQGVKQE